MRSFSLLQRLVLLILMLITTPALAFSKGDIVDMDIRWGYELTDALRAQMPIFGIDTRAVFTPKNDVFSMVLDHTRGLPTINLQKDQLILKSWKITIVHTADEIQSITGSNAPEYGEFDQNQQKHEFVVQYEWIKEPELSLQAGLGIMLVATLIACIIILMQLCGLIDGESSLQNSSSSKRDAQYEVGHNKKW